MKNVIKTTALAVIVLLTLAGFNSCNTFTSKSNCDAQLHEKDSIIKKLTGDNDYWKDEWSELQRDNNDLQNFVDSVHFAPAVIGLTAEMLGISDSVLKGSSYWAAESFKKDISFQYLSDKVASYVNLDRTQFGHTLENAGALHWVFNNVKPILPGALDLLGKKEDVKYWANELYPYFTLEADANQRAEFNTYYAAHGADTTDYGTGNFNFESDDWKNIQIKFVKEGGLTTTELQENYYKWLFVNRHYNSAEATQAGNGAAFLKEGSIILDYLRKIE